MIVLLPLPLRPTIPTNEPAGTSKLTLLTTRGDPSLKEKSISWKETSGDRR